MRYRDIRVKATSQWIKVLFTVDGDAFSVTPARHRADIAKALVVPSTSLEVVDGDEDHQAGTLLEIATPPAPAPTRIEELLAIPRADWTAEQQSELLEIVTRDSTKP